MKYIKLNQDLETNTGFIANEAIVTVTYYNINEHKVLGVTGATRNTNINFLLYKSIEDMNEGMQPIQPLTLNQPVPMMHGMFNVPNEIVTDENVYGFVLDHLINYGYAAELITV